MKPRAAMVFVLAALLPLGFAGELQAKETRAVVLDFGGKKTAAMRRAVLGALKKRVRIAPRRMVEDRAEALGADLSSAGGVARVLGPIEVELLVRGEVSGSGKRARTRVELVAADGRVLASLTGGSPSSAGARRAMARSVKEALPGALAALDESAPEDADDEALPEGDTQSGRRVVVRPGARRVVVPGQDLVEPAPSRNDGARSDRTLAARQGVAGQDLVESPSHNDGARSGRTVAAREASEDPDDDEATDLEERPRTVSADRAETLARERARAEAAAGLRKEDRTVAEAREDRPVSEVSGSVAKDERPARAPSPARGATDALSPAELGASSQRETTERSALSFEGTAGLSARRRRASTQLATDRTARLDSGLYPELALELKVKPFGASGLSGVYARAEAQFALGLGTLQRAEEIETSVFRILVALGYAHALGPLELAGELGFGVDAFSLGPNEVMDSTSYTHVRAAAGAAVDLLGFRWSAQLGLRPVLGAGDLGSSRGQSGGAFGLDVGGGVLGRTEAGFLYELEATYVAYALRFGAPAAGFSAAVGGKDTSIAVTLSAGWAL